MNIIVRHLDGTVSCRPDTSWERENKDIYVPCPVEALRYAPVLFVRISKAGKCVGQKFAQRYWDGFNYGVLLYGGIADEAASVPANEEGGIQAPLHWSECVDHTSILPFPLYNPLVIENEDKEFILRKNGKLLYSTTEGSAQMVENAICEASELVSLRIGDIIAIELQTPECLECRKDSGKEKICVKEGVKEGKIEDENQPGCLLEATFLETETLSHRIIF